MPENTITIEQSTNHPSFTEHNLDRGEFGKIYARDYPGNGPAFVLMHGFPGNLHIYDDLIFSRDY